MFPTSLIVVLLVAAWLAVLVPIFAKRREPVPETEMDGGTFRVLRRASATMRRRPRLGPRTVDDADGADDIETDRGPNEELDEDVLEQNESAESEFDSERVAEVREPQLHRVGGGSTRWRPSGLRKPASTPAEVHSHATPSYRDDYLADSSASEWSEAEFDSIEPSPYTEPDHRTAEHRSLPSGVDESQLRPVPRRRGRGGYDPAAAEIARAYRYSRRRRITVILLLATVAFAVAAYFYKPVLWAGTAVFGLLLIGYLCYLRRQVRIENDIQQRRLARLRRARQIRPEYDADLGGAPVRSGYHPLGAIPVSQVPPTGYRRGREVIDLDDDDPSFDDLDYYMPVAYRRASGQ